MEKNKGINIGQLKSFMSELGKIVIVDQKNKKVEPKQIDQDGIKNLVEDLKAIHESLLLNDSLGMNVNVWETAGLKQDEVRNSKVLSWCLNPKGNHGQKAIYLQKFLSLLPKPFSNLPCSDSHVVAESCILGDRSERVDIEIESKEFLFIIEVKINASEGEEQLARYLQVAKAKAKDKLYKVIYLTKNGKLPDQYKGNENLIALSWKQLAKEFMKMPNHISSSDGNRGVWLIQQFAQNINQF